MLYTVALIKPLNTHADLDTVNRSDPSDRVERTAAARYVGDVRRSTDAIINSTEDRTAIVILKQFQPAVLQRPTITNSAIERTSVESDFRQ